MINAIACERRKSPFEALSLSPFIKRNLLDKKYKKRYNIFNDCPSMKRQL